jgi:murein L,D-transpeptidase YcbB/YkuD
VRHDKGWDRSAIDATVKGGATKSVSLKDPIPVLIAYWTAWVEDDRLQFRNDLYGRDAKILEGLAEPFRRPKRAVAVN